MVVLRLTRKIRKRLGHAVGDRLIDSGHSTTALGDWYVNLVRCGREQLVLYTSSTSLLPVVCQARGLAKNIGEQLAVELEHLLVDIGADPAAIRNEVARMKPVGFAKTEDRRVLGTMTEFAFMIQRSRRDRRDEGLRELSRWLSRTPCSPFGGVFPDERAVELLGGARR